MKPIHKTLIWLSVFSIAMGLLESAVVIYLRELYYPSGFHFPLSRIPDHVAGIELLREIATILMLIGVGVLAGKNFSQRFAMFLYAFAIWDLFYYVFLKLILNWPASLGTWDILFLIPVPWVGPVIAPCILSLSMIFFTFIIIWHADKGVNTRIQAREWMLLGCGSLLVVYSFCEGYLHQIWSSGASLLEKNNGGWIRAMDNYVPHSFDWDMFAAGEMMLLVAMAVYVMRIRKKELILFSLRNPRRPKRIGSVN